MTENTGPAGSPDGGDSRRRSGPERHRGAVTLRHQSIPRSTADERLLDSRGRGDWKTKDAWRALRILSEFVEGFDTLADLPSAVSVFGSARSRPDSPECKLAEQLGAALAAAGYAVITGGGPGVMEAANLGAYLAAGSAAELSAAIDTLAAAPDFADHEPFTAAALAVRAAHPAPPAAAHDVVARLSHGGLALPTWLYGHEPANLFAGQIGKYFSNAVREDSILRLARGGIVFAPGRAGTVQEVFQAATKTFYGTDGPSGPFVFLDRAHWSRLPVEALLRPLLTASPHGDLSHLIVVTDSIDEAIEAITVAGRAVTP